jgi:hypothetical protein
MPDLRQNFLTREGVLRCHRTRPATRPHIGHRQPCHLSWKAAHSAQAVCNVSAEKAAEQARPLAKRMEGDKEEA